MLRVTPLMVIMHLWELCVEVRGDSLGGEQCNLLLLVVVDVVVVILVKIETLLKGVGPVARRANIV